MKIKPIILVPGEPNSIFFEIFFKAIKSKNYKSPLLLICCKKLISQETNFNFLSFLSFESPCQFLIF